MLVCPNCHAALSAVSCSPGVFWRCPSCDGRSATIPWLRRNVSARVVNALWLSAKSGTFPRLRPCPACGNRMAEVVAETGHGKEHIDVCTACEFVWFDRSEYAELPSIPNASSWKDKLSPEAREKLALREIELIQQQAQEKARENPNAPDEWWQWIPGILSMPIEQDAECVRSRPWITWGATALIAVVSLAAFPDLQTAIADYGLIPDQFGRDGGLTFLTSFFLHGNLFHLLSNVYFLLVFGDNVEDWLGKRWYVLLLASAALAGDALHILGDPGSTTPCIGASGGISGIIAFYALKFPNVRLSFLVRIAVWVRWISVPAYILFLVWITLQFLGAWMQTSASSHVAYLAHLGGVAVGFIFWLASRKN